jgi:hypothetical protein
MKDWSAAQVQQWARHCFSESPDLAQLVAALQDDETEGEDLAEVTERWMNRKWKLPQNLAREVAKLRDNQLEQNKVLNIKELLDKCAWQDLEQVGNIDWWRMDIAEP